jgi:hypothetical protein
MFRYAQLNQDNVCIGIATSTHLMNGDIISISDTDDVLWKKYENGVWSTETFEIKNTRFSKVEFENRFIWDEQLAIEAASETDPGVRVFYRKILTAEFIDLADTNTQNGIAYLVSQGLLTPERGTTILTP